MPNVTIKMGLDNRVKPGLQTRDEIIANLQAQGIPAQAANPVFDPITGKLIRADINLPDTAAPQATAAVNANSGVATATAPIPIPLLSQNVTNMVLATLVLVDSGFARHFIAVFAATSNGLKSGGVVLLGQLLATGFSTIKSNPDSSVFTHTLLQISNTGGSDAGSDLTLPVDDLTLSLDGRSLLIDTAAPITVPKKLVTAGGRDNAVGLFVDNSGKLYPHFTKLDTLPFGFRFDAPDYDTAITLPSL